MKDTIYTGLIALLLLAVVMLGRTVDRLLDQVKHQNDLWTLHVDDSAPRRVAPPFTITLAD